MGARGRRVWTKRIAARPRLNRALICVRRMADRDRTRRGQHGDRPADGELRRQSSTEERADARATPGACSRTDGGARRGGA
jgi:hypothetical protein